MPFSTKALQETTTNIVGDTTSTAVDANDASSLVISSSELDENNEPVLPAEIIGIAPDAE